MNRPTARAEGRLVDRLASVALSESNRKKGPQPREDPPTPLIETNTEGSVGTICLDHFEKRNSLTGALSDEIIAFSTPSQCG